MSVDMCILCPLTLCSVMVGVVLYTIWCACGCMSVDVDV